MRWPRAENAIRLAALALVSIALASCGPGGPPRKTCYPVKGQLFYKSQPAAGAKVTLHPQGAQPGDWPEGYPRGTVGSDGSFQIETYAENDGAPAGDYDVLVTWPQADHPDEESETVDRFGGQYAEPTTSKIQVKVNEGPTELPPIRIP